jgi:hypothetical protein
VRLALLCWLSLTLSCSSDALESESSDPGAGAGGAPVGGGGRPGGGSPTGTGGTGGKAPSAPTYADTVLGPADGASLALVTLFEPSRPVSATALAFDPKRPGELWVTLREFRVDSPCTSDVSTGCQALIGRVALIQGATGTAPKTTIKTDGNAWHFMRRPSAIAFGDNGNLATCGEHRTGNFDDQAVNYMGPTLWSSDPEIFGVEPLPSQNGTHLDMLHDSPFCMGIAHERDNVYWVFNGQLGALDRYDFREPHEIGGEDHADGELRRFVEGQLSRAAETPSHLVIDEPSGFLYAVDGGHARILRLDIGSGIENGEVPTNDPLLVHARMQDADLDELVPPGTLELPSGIALAGETLFVTDSTSSKIYAFNLDGELLRWADSGLPAGTLSGVAVGSDDRLYLSDLRTGKVYRVLPAE